MKKVLLINPPFYRFVTLQQDYVPLSLLAVGSKLKSEGYDVKIKNMEVGAKTHYEGYDGRQENYNKFINGISDLNHSIWNELRATISKERPDKIGVTVLNVKYKSFMSIYKIAKQEFGIPVFVGGAHPTISPEEYPSDVEVFRGEYESNGGRLQDLDELPFPDFDMLLDKYSPNGYAHVMSSRGCPFNCRFCSSSNIWGRKVTCKSVDRIIREMKYIEDAFKSDFFTFWDETFTLNKKKLLEFCDKYNLRSSWRCDTRADVITDEMVKCMKKSGCKQMSIGLESGVNRILEYINKGEKTETFLKAADILNKNKIQWKAYCIIGFPEETEEDILTTMKFIKSLNPFRITLSFFTPYKGTELYTECLEEGLINDNYDSALFSHQSPYNYFCPKIPKDRYNEIKHIVAKEIDEYNAKALEVWH